MFLKSQQYVNMDLKVLWLKPQHYMELVGSLLLQFSQFIALNSFFVLFQSCLVGTGAILKNSLFAVTRQTHSKCHLPKIFMVLSEKYFFYSNF